MLEEHVSPKKHNASRRLAYTLVFNVLKNQMRSSTKIKIFYAAFFESDITSYTFI